MKVNLGVILTDAQRVVFNEALGKPKMASRKQVVTFLQGCLDTLILTEEPPKVIKKKKKASKAVQTKVVDVYSSNGDSALEGKSKEYILGWNKVKFRQQLHKNEG